MNERSTTAVAALVDRERDFTATHRRTLLKLISELLSGVLPRYRALLERGGSSLDAVAAARGVS